MKKLLALIITSILVITLASCNNTTPDYTLHDTDNSDLKIVSEWLNSKNITTNATPIISRSSKDSSGTEVYLPTDMVASSRYVVVNLEDVVYNGSNTGSDWHHNLFNSLSFEYLKLYDSVDLQTVANQITTESNAEDTEDTTVDAIDSIKAGFGSTIAAKTFSLTTVVPNVDLEEVSYVEGEDRSLVIVYMPVLVEYYTAKGTGVDAVMTLHTFALVPVYYEIAYTVNNTLLDDNALKATFKQVNLATTGQLINDLAE